MPSLRDLQRDFFAAVRHPSGNEACAAHLLPGGLPPERRMQIYQNNHRISLTAALAACYPVIQRLVGDDFFNAMSRRFIEHHPPEHGQLLLFGEHFPGFLARQRELAGMDYIVDVARLEWLRQEAYHAADAPRLQVTRLADVPEAGQESLRLGLHPSARLFRSPYPVVSIWAANQRETEPETIDLTRGGEQALAWRSPRGVEVAALEPGAAAMIRSLMDTDPFAQACEAGLAAEEGLDPGAVLAGLCRDGVISTASWTTTNDGEN